MPNEADTCRRNVVPKLQAAGWEDEPHRLNEQVYFTDGPLSQLRWSSPSPRTRRRARDGRRSGVRPAEHHDMLIRYANVPMAASAITHSSRPFHNDAQVFWAEEVAMEYDKMVPILDRVWDRLDFLFSTDGGDQDHWRQEPYRSDFFDVFRDAFAVEPLDGDEVFDIVADRHLKDDDEQYEEKHRELWSICNAWSEWLYAWQHYPAAE